MSGRKITDQQVALFAKRFTGRTDVHGTYDPASGRPWQVKQSVTLHHFKRHLLGIQPLGIYMLLGDKIHFGVVDFDDGSPEGAVALLNYTRFRGMPGLLERSKSKGYHCWFFFGPDGVSAKLFRSCMRNALQTIGYPKTEIFPKQDTLDPNTSYGNYINLPMFGRLVAKGKTVFIRENLTPYVDPWEMLQRVPDIPQSVLVPLADSIWSETEAPAIHHNEIESKSTDRTYGLMPCARRMLEEGVTHHQRVACFRLAVQLRKSGLPYDYALTVLMLWSQRNRPIEGKDKLSAQETQHQVASAYRTRGYLGCGCDELPVRDFCDVSCSLRKEN